MSNTMQDGLRYWSIGFSKNVGGDYWPRPRVERTISGFRVGWRMTAYGIHFRAGTNSLSEAEMDAINKALREFRAASHQQQAPIPLKEGDER